MANLILPEPDINVSDVVNSLMSEADSLCGDNTINSTTIDVLCHEGSMSVKPMVNMDTCVSETDLVSSSTDDMESAVMYATMPSVSTVNNPTLQALLSSPVTMPQSGGSNLGTLEEVQIITLSNPEVFAANASRIAWKIVHNDENPGVATLVPIDSDMDMIHNIMMPKLEKTPGGIEDVLNNPNELTSSTSSVMMLPDDGTSSLLMPAPRIPPPPPPMLPLPLNCPAWAARLKNCEEIGDAYRGYVESEVELDLLLTFHKQQTLSFWGTRQSPSPAKPSTRLMWKSQYVPFDGIPFINAGSRAIVMECQFGPRRKGNPNKQPVEQVGVTPAEYRQTCPARIYIKKVLKFPSYAIDVNTDKKAMKISMDRAFNELKLRGIEKATGFEHLGQERYYVQMPTEKAHEYHEESQSPVLQLVEPPSVPSGKQRLHPRVAEKIRELVAAGETRIYAIRRALRGFVCRELFPKLDQHPERHNLTCFPTINDLKNHIHQALKDIETGNLPLTAPTVNIEIITNSDGTVTPVTLPNNVVCEDMHDQLLWQQASGSDEEGPTPETVTVTLTQNPTDDGQHVISRVETHLSDGTTQVSSSLSPETAQLLCKLQPSMRWIQTGNAVSQLQVHQSSAEMEKNDISLQLGQLQAAQIGQMNSEEMETINSEQLGQINPNENLPQFNLEQLVLLNSGQLNAAQLEQLNMAQLGQNLISVAQLAQITGTQLAQINGAQLAQVNGGQLAQINGAQFAQINGAQLAQINGAQFGQLTEAQLGQSTAEQMPPLTRGQFLTSMADTQSSSVTSIGQLPPLSMGQVVTSVGDLSPLVMGAVATSSGQLPLLTSGQMATSSGQLPLLTGGQMVTSGGQLPLLTGGQMVTSFDATQTTTADFNAPIIQGEGRLTCVGEIPTSGDLQPALGMEVMKIGPATLVEPKMEGFVSHAHITDSFMSQTDTEQLSKTIVSFGDTMT